MTGKGKPRQQAGRPRLQLVRPVADARMGERRREARARLHELLARVEAGTVHPATVEPQLARLVEVLSVDAADSLAAYLRDEIGVAELAAVTWAAQRLPARQVVHTFARLAQDAKTSLAVRVKAVHILVAATDESLTSFEARLQQFGLLSDEVAALLRQMGNASLLVLVKQIGHARTIPAAVGAVILFQELAGEDLNSLLAQLGSMRDPAAANILLGLGVGGRTAEVRAQARRMLTRMLTARIQPTSEAFAWLGNATYLGSFRMGRSLHVVWQYPSQQVQSAVFTLTPRGVSSDGRGWQLESIRLSTPISVSIARALIQVQMSRTPHSLTFVPFGTVRGLIERLWPREGSGAYGRTHLAEAIQGFLEYWVLQGNLLGAGQESGAGLLDAAWLAGRHSQAGSEGGEGPQTPEPDWVASISRQLDQVAGIYAWTPAQVAAAQAFWRACWRQAKLRRPHHARWERTWAAAVAQVCQGLWGIRTTCQQTASGIGVEPALLARHVRRLARTAGIPRGQKVAFPL